MKISVCPVNYNSDKTAIIFHCYNRNHKNTMVVYGIFETEIFEIKKAKIVDLRIFENMVKKLNNFGFTNENYNKNNPSYLSNIQCFMQNNKT